MKIYKGVLLILVPLSWAIVSGYVLYSWGHPTTVWMVDGIAKLLGVN